MTNENNEKEIKKFQPETEQAIASSSKRITSTEITENLDKIIAENKKMSVVSSSESKKNLEDEIKENNLYLMQKSKREKLKENFSGLDKVLYERLEKKAGTRQMRNEEIKFRPVVWLPVIGDLVNNPAIEIEKNFSVSEVKEIVRELGIDKNVENTALLETVRQQVIDFEKAAAEKIEAEKKNSQKLKEDGETKIKGYEEQGQRISKKLVETEKAEKKEREKFFEVSEKLEKEKNNLSELAKEKERLTSEKEELNEKLTNFLNKESEWESQKQEIEQLINKKEQEVNELQKKLSLSEKEVKNYEEKAAEIAERLKKNRTLPDPAKISHEELKKEYKNLENQHQQQEILIEAGKVEISNKKERINFLNNGIENLKNEIINWEQKLSVKRGEICELEKKINEVKATMTEQEERIKELEGKISRLEQEKKTLESEIERLRKKWEAEIEETAKEKIKFNNSLIEKQGQYDRLELETNDKIRHFESELDSNAKWTITLNERIDTAKQEKIELEKRAQNAEAEVQEKETAINQHLRKINELENKEKGNIFQQALNKFGFNSLGGIIQNGIILVAALFFLAVAAWLWKNLVKPAFSKSENQQIKELSQKNSELEGVLIAKDKQITELKTTLSSLKLEAEKTEQEKDGKAETEPENNHDKK